MVLLSPHTFWKRLKIGIRINLTPFSLNSQLIMHFYHQSTNWTYHKLNLSAFTLSVYFNQCGNKCIKYKISSSTFLCDCLNLYCQLCSHNQMNKWWHIVFWYLDFIYFAMKKNGSRTFSFWIHGYLFGILER